MILKERRRSQKFLRSDSAPLMSMYETFLVSLGSDDVVYFEHVVFVGVAVCTGGCGSMYEIVIDAECFKGKRTLLQHKMVNQVKGSLVIVADPQMLNFWYCPCVQFCVSMCHLKSMLHYCHIFMYAGTG